MDPDLSSAVERIEKNVDAVTDAAVAARDAAVAARDAALAALDAALAARGEALAARDEAHAAREETKSLARVVGAFAEQLRNLGGLVEIIAKDQARLASTYGALSERFSEMMTVTIRARTGDAERYQHVEERLAELERLVSELRGAAPR